MKYTIVYRERSFSFQIYFNEGSEAPHVHITRGSSAAKFWLNPVRLCWKRGFTANELRWAKKLLTERHDFFMEQWNAVQSKAR